MDRRGKFSEPSDILAIRQDNDMESVSGAPVRKRRRPAVVCIECRRRKVACDRKLPCGSCLLHNADCAYRSTNSPIATSQPRGTETPVAQPKSTSLPASKDVPQSSRPLQAGDLPRDGDVSADEDYLSALMGPLTLRQAGASI